MSDAEKKPAPPPVRTTLPAPASERNSEGKLTAVLTVVGFIIMGLAGAVEALSEAGLAEHWPAFATVASIFGVVSKLAWEYTRGRSAKKAGEELGKSSAGFVRKV